MFKGQMRNLYGKLESPISCDVVVIYYVRPSRRPSAVSPRKTVSWREDVQEEEKAAPRSEPPPAPDPPTPPPVASGRRASSCGCWLS